VGEYAAYLRSFIRIRDERIRGLVDAELDSGLLWPAPLIGLNPTFAPGSWVADLVAEGALHAACARVFQIKPDPADRALDRPLRLHRHQRDAVLTARAGRNYVLTTGTGSGKSLAYLVPIVDRVLREGSGRGIRAIVVYPMNALANSQYGELEKFLRHGYPDGRGPVTFARYTGQEGEEERRAIVARPPDILLTNYVMLELLLTRPQEAPLIAAAQGLRFLVLDELHTYRGRQGADVALLVRRTRDLLAADRLQCVGTSATLAGGGTFERQRAVIADLATRCFGAPVRPEHVIGETLRRVTPERDPADPAFVAALRERLADPDAAPADFAALAADPLASWVESTFGVVAAPGSSRLVRRTPRAVTGPGGAAAELAARTGAPEAACRAALERLLLAGYACTHPETGFPAFAFRLHQFVGGGDTVYASLEPEATRHLTVHGQKSAPGGRALLPLVFCRECGQEYYAVRLARDPATGLARLLPRPPLDRADDEGEPGYLYASAAQPWPADEAARNARLPDDWLEPGPGGEPRPRASRRRQLPTPLVVDAAGTQADAGLAGHFVPAPFPFCLRCGVAYNANQRSDYGKLASLSAGGRSTATTILSLFALRFLRESADLPPTARKLLSFTDNRQDASLQAGHFNDFVDTGLLRAALYRAVRDAGPEGLGHEELTQAVFAALDLPLAEYAADPAVRYQALADTKRALRDVLGYRLYRDLKRGWRVTAPNLEQCGLLDIAYLSLDDLCANDEDWQETHPALVTATPATRRQVARTLLDYLRRELAVNVHYLDREAQERLQQQSGQFLVAPWALDEYETLEAAAVAFPRAGRERERRDDVFVSARGGFGLYLRRARTFPDYDGRLTMQETGAVIAQLFDRLRLAGILAAVQEPVDDRDVPGYQVKASALRWLAGDGSAPFHDPIRVPSLPDTARQANAFFVQYYRLVALALRGIQAREHTAQVPYEERQERERDFRSATLPVLFCSPTMELGVDIAELNVVGLRNVPPTPANYAQRSGRAGRQGQPALVFNYCATGSPHDQYYFRRPALMVAGAVAPPRLDLANEDLVRAHVHAIWLTETRQSLGRS
ncbi:MAG TPA: DEAD/DEAH box helicase, partial [Thermomicrobiales bacterium]|nr:DEAD/DEAH box helicase [Thermomicrobiales bacterium]